MSSSETINVDAGAVERAERLIRNGTDVQAAAEDAAHFFSCSSVVVKAAVLARRQHAKPAETR